MLLAADGKEDASPGVQVVVEINVFGDHNEVLVDRSSIEAALHSRPKLRARSRSFGHRLWLRLVNWGSRIVSLGQGLAVALIEMLKLLGGG